MRSEEAPLTCGGNVGDGGIEFGTSLGGQLPSTYREAASPNKPVDMDWKKENEVRRTHCTIGGVALALKAFEASHPQVVLAAE